MTLAAYETMVHHHKDVVRALSDTQRSVVTFGGFGELGYEDEDDVLHTCACELDRFDPVDTIINTATLLTTGFRMGIAMIYALAKERGFTTSGVHPSIALEDPSRHTVAPGVDHVFFVRDDTWGGCDVDGRPSNTLRVLLEVSSEFIALGGGHHTAQELRAFLMAGKRVRFHKVSMHKQTTERWSNASGVRFDDHWGSAYRVWKCETHQ